MKQFTLFHILALATLTFFLFPVELKAQTSEKKDDPKVGVVLSGGAAKGLAHIGVLKVLEEAGIYPDYITGTSMGAIIGGLYALGYSAEELSSLTRSINWDKILTDRVPMNKIVMEEKANYDRFIVDFPIRNYEFKLPSGLNEGYQLERLFSDLTWGATGIRNFDSLPIPFHCMAVDIIEGKVVEFNSGDLSTALRASMAIPGVFAPTQKDSMMLVDGGVIRNFPVEEIKKMGADIIIGVYVGFEENVTPEDLFSLTDILTRTTIFFGVFDSKKQMEKVDILILPDMENIGATDFMKSKEIEKRGEEATRMVYDRLKKLADSLQIRTQPVQKLKGPEYIYISEIDVENLRFVEKSFVIGKGGIFPGTYTTQKELRTAVEKIFGTQYFKKVNYRLIPLEEQKYRLIYQAKESTRAFIKMALHYDNQKGAGLILNGSLRNYMIPNSRINLTANVAENPGFKMDIYHYFGKQQNLIDHYFFHWDKTDLPVFYQEEEIGGFSHGNITAGLGMKYNHSFKQQIGSNVYYETNSVRPSVAAQTIIPEANFSSFRLHGFGFSAYYRLNTLDDYYFPTKGSKINVNFKRIYKPFSAYNAEENQNLDEEIFNLNLVPFNNFYLHAEQYFPVAPKFSFKLGTSMGLSSVKTPITNHYVLGGTMQEDRFHFEPFSGMNFGEQIVPNFIKANTSLDFHLTSRLFLTFSGNLALTTQKPQNMYSGLIHSNWDSFLKGYAGGIRINSVLGPIVFMVGDLNTDQRTRWYFSLGYTF